MFQLNSLAKESSNGLRTLLDNIFKHLRALNSLGLDTENWDPVLIFLISSKFDKTTPCEWEKHKCTEEFPKLKDMQEFIKTRADILETLEINAKANNNNSYNDSRFTRQTSMINTNAKCNYCKEQRLIYSCEAFRKLSIPSRCEKVNQLNLCLNCLCTGHDAQNCRSRPCKRCKLKHHSLLHSKDDALPQQMSAKQETPLTSPQIFSDFDVKFQ